jgi:hypothetical protein
MVRDRPATVEPFQLSSGPVAYEWIYHGHKGLARFRQIEMIDTKTA